MNDLDQDQYKKSKGKLTEHSIDYGLICEGALDVISQLHATGFKAYIVGGGVRDLLLDLHPKDFDIATDATPEDVRQLFDNSRIIGRRFRIVHVYFEGGFTEVATFRAANTASVNTQGRIIADNTFGNIEEDAFRRDFTVNALFYDSEKNQILDLVDGLQDIDAKLLRVIGDPDLRFREDPVRMLRAVRLATKLNFEIEKSAKDAIFRLGCLLSEVPSARLFDEMIKLFHGGFGLKTYQALREFDLFRHMFPLTEQVLEQEANTFTNLVKLALENTDERIRSGKSVTPAFLYAVFLWGPMRKLSKQLELDGITPQVAHDASVKDTILSQLPFTSIPKRFSYSMRDIWNLQYRFYRRRGKRAYQLFEHDRFRAAYDFLCLRASAGEPVDELCEWWTVFQDVDDATRRKMTRAPQNRSSKQGSRANPRLSKKKTYH
ncbi:MAG: polynucleotide adenylyltransferase PcnB [Gammaproteobacteria bacterium]|nr:polynucleotide adenylyltransferase PcnB [Gammaproteobacteria bacterium]